MNRKVRIGRSKAPPLLHVFLAPDPDLPLGSQMPDLRCTRIWMSAVPAETVELRGISTVAPAYGCVIAEVYDDDPLQRARQRVVLDECVGLDPADFSAEELEKWDIHPLSTEKPTLFGLRRGLVALKDLYRPDLCILPPPKESTFNLLVQTTEGMQYYDSQQEHRFESWFPFYHAQLSVTKQPKVGFLIPEEEDPVMNREIVRNLHAVDQLIVADNDIRDFESEEDRRNDPRRPMKLFHTRTDWHPTISRAWGLILREMQDRDLTFQMRQWKVEEPGYIDVREAMKKHEQEVQDLMDQEIDDIVMVTTDMARPMWGEAWGEEDEPWL